MHMMLNFAPDPTRQLSVFAASALQNSSGLIED